MRSSPTTSPYALALKEQLPEVAYTRGGTAFNPNDSWWHWTEDVFSVSLNFRSLNFPDQQLMSLKRTLTAFAEVNSSNYLRNLFGTYKHFLESRQTPEQIASISATEVSSYAARLKQHEKWRIGTLNVLLQKWAALDLPGLEPGCAEFLEECRKPGNLKGEAVRTRDPVKGPFSESEYTALYKAVDAAFGMGQLPRWVLLLTRLLFACGGRISQYASLKVLDFNLGDGRYELMLPQVKQRAQHSREVLKSFDLSPQTGQILREHIQDLIEQGFVETDALFPAGALMPLGPQTKLRQLEDLFEGHCTQLTLMRLFVGRIRDIAPPTERLNFAITPISTRRFRYTFGTRLVEEGASKAVVADQLGHTDLQNVDHYFEASPKIVDNIDRAMDSALAPLAAAFRGRLIEGEAQSTHKGAPGSRIIDFRVETKPLASCAGQGAGCSFNKPVACYTCFKFEPWLDAPHEKVLERLQRERKRYSGDVRIAAINDDAIMAIRQVIAECEQVRKQRSGKGEP